MKLLASDWHFLEKEMLKSKLKADCSSSRDWKARVNTCFMFGVMKIYRICSGYGESPGRALVSLIFLMMLILFLPRLVNDISIWDANYPKYFAWYLPLLKVEFDIPVSGWAYVIKYFVVTLVAAQTALLGFALRNKLRR